ncbi:unnamed protein product [Owenia fusiformis]|uniref:Uncharacterized protein n=1 Tax=Owenia fusiformis TaxID=6347 RepID=A0A8J1XSI7_OWEFU|nr:unnamed protein product [Owenia fusiformis]
MIWKALIGVSTTAVIVAMVTRAWFVGQSRHDGANALKEWSNKPGEEKLKNHTKEFNNPIVRKVTDGVYVAIGFALANSIMLEAPEGLIIVDVTETVESGRNVLKAFREISDKPIKALIYTHNHADHTCGAKAFIEDPANPPDIWSHYTLPTQFKRVFTVVNHITYIRAMRQFGVFLEGRGHLNSGIGPRLGHSVEFGIVLPNRLMSSNDETITIAGLTLRLIHVPGETPDQICVWIPEKRVLLPADDIYKAFPNLYAIRGTPPRNTIDWVNSIDKMRHLRPQFLVPSHTKPLEGVEFIFKIFTDYRDAIQFVHDQTVRWINKGLYPDEIVERVHLPDNLAFNPFLQEFYGTVAWSVRGVFDSYIGWFSGDPVDLNPLSPRDKASRIVKLAGGTDAAVAAAMEAFQEDDLQWALELSSSVLITDASNAKAQEINIKALQGLGVRQTSPNARNYYLTRALERSGEIPTIAPNPVQRSSLVKIIPVNYIMDALSRRLKAEDAIGVNQTLVLHFPDTNTTFSLHLRNCVLEVTDYEVDGWDIKATMDEQIYREFAAKERSPGVAYAKGDMTVEGGILAFRKFMNYFDIE